MDRNRYVSFLLGAAIGATVGLIIGLLFAPQSNSDESNDLESDNFSERIRLATDEWLAKLRATASDMVVKGYISPEEASSQISGLLKKVRG